MNWRQRLLSRKKMEMQLEKELRFHLEQHTNDLIAQGIDPVEARRQAMLALGGLEQVKEKCRDARGTRWLEEFFQDLRFGMRMLLKQRGFTAVAALTLALGMGANTAIFSVLNAVLLQPLPYEKANELVMYYFTNAQNEEEWVYAPEAYHDLKTKNNVFTDIAAWGNNTWPVNMTGDGEPVRLQGFQVSANLFKVLGVGAAQGRSFLPEEDLPGNNRVVVISHEMWQRQFGGDSGIIERSIILNGASYKVIGVMPADFRFVLKTDVWTTLAPTSAENNARSRIALLQVARLKPDVSTEQVRMEIDNLLRPYINDPDSAQRAVVKPLQTVLMGDMSQPLIILFAAAGFVLLIACVNVANLLLARASVRRRELAIRSALGASRIRIIQQLMVESATLAFLGGACGLLMAHWCIRFLVSGLPEWVAAKNSNVVMLKLDGWALGFMFALSLLTILIFGLIPAFQASKLSLNEELKQGNRNETQGRGQNRWRSFLVLKEIALALILMVGAGLMVKSFWRLINVHRGFESAGVVTAKIDLSTSKYGEFNEVVTFYQQLLERISAIPGVQHAGIINGFLDRGCRINIVEGPSIPEEQRPVAMRYEVSTDYFQAMGIPLRSGRFFSEHDVKDATPVAIIDETLVRRYFPNNNPIGKHLQFEDTVLEIVGIVGATRAWKPYSAGGHDVFPRIYLPYQQEKPWSTMLLVVRTQSGDPLNLIPVIRRELAAIDKNQPIHSFKTLEQSVAELSNELRFSMLLLAAFAALAALLAAVGIYGVMSYAVTERRHEIGIRIALGAKHKDIIKLIVGQGLALILMGLTIGLFGAFTLTHYIKTLLFNVGQIDMLTYILVTIMLMGIALISCYIPARRAATIDPMAALKYE